MGNPFNDQIDWAIQGKLVRAYSNNAAYEGWAVMMHHSKNSIILHDATEINRDHDVGTVFMRVCDTVEVLKPRKLIEWREVAELEPYPGYDIDFEPEERMIRRAHRNKSTGAFPVVTDDGLILNGHKRLAACKKAGLERHAVEVVDVTPKQARELFELAHPESELSENSPNEQQEPPSSTTGRRIGGRVRSYHQHHSQR